jgi:hypothetical protein
MKKNKRNPRGAGRKPLPPGEKKVPVSYKLAPIVVTYLQSRSNATETLKMAVVRSRDFRDWQRQRDESD